MRSGKTNPWGDASSEDTMEHYYNKFNGGGYKRFPEAGNLTRLEPNVTVNID
jgi:hypothetical protein